MKKEKINKYDIWLFEMLLLTWVTPQQVLIKELVYPHLGLTATLLLELEELNFIESQLISKNRLCYYITAEGIKHALDMCYNFLYYYCNNKPPNAVDISDKDYLYLLLYFVPTERLPEYLVSKYLPVRDAALEVMKNREG